MSTTHVDKPCTPAQALDAAVTVLAVLGNPLALAFPSSSLSDLAGVVVVDPAGVRFVDPTGVLFVVWVLGFTFMVVVVTVACRLSQGLSGRVVISNRLIHN